jgi:glucose dehydrogenase
MPVYEMSLDAVTLWMDTGLTLDGTEAVTVEATGQWTANPATGMVDANGHPGLVAKEGYNLPGEPEGLLVCKVGATVLRLGTNGTIPAGQAGELYISINDDMNARYGVGFPDNQGKLSIKITVP